MIHSHTITGFFFVENFLSLDLYIHLCDSRDQFTQCYFWAHQLPHLLLQRSQFLDLHVIKTLITGLTCDIYLQLLHYRMINSILILYFQNCSMLSSICLNIIFTLISFGRLLFKDHILTLCIIMLQWNSQLVGIDPLVKATINALNKVIVKLISILLRQHAWLSSKKSMM